MDRFDQVREIEALKTDTGRGNAVVFDVRRYVLVMMITAGQFGDVGMLEWIIPTDFLVEFENPKKPPAYAPDESVCGVN